MLVAVRGRGGRGVLFEFDVFAGLRRGPRLLPPPARAHPAAARPAQHAQQQHTSLVSSPNRQRGLSSLLYEKGPHPYFSPPAPAIPAGCVPSCDVAGRTCRPPSSRHMTAAPRQQQSRSARLRGQLRPSDDRLVSDRWARSLSGPSPACRSPVRLAARGPLACSHRRRASRRRHASLCTD